MASYVLQAARAAHGATQAAYESLPLFTPAFNPKTDIPDLTGRVVVVTGANTGLGERSAYYLARNGARVVLACRSRDKGERSAERIRKDADVKGGVEVGELDLQRFESVVAFVRWFEARYERLDVLMLNAGIMAAPNFSYTPDGLEAQWQTNHLSHFLLTHLLLPTLLKTASTNPHQDVRVVVLSSLGHLAASGIDYKNAFVYVGAVRWGWLGGAFLRYAETKLANILFTHRLSRLLSSSHPNIYVIACHPGNVATDLARDTSYFTFLVDLVKAIGVEGVVRRVMPVVDVEKGVATQLFLATSPHIPLHNLTGRYFVPSSVPHPAAPSPWVTDKAAEELWKWSEGVVRECVGEGVWRVVVMGGGGGGM
ncbi:NAD(P)-binding protein [Gonapodya prolifera JEL478]|uniref:NAD(P)-binding protein n=1 Tax=Gonapodya prolifera (strain JEL478) TaxID=1344416 RepID=A0A138ZZB6_GONPJ|nr:NAD(P)-binding protein [Gonapodya prolifera JEL478]|eukprot:KXS09852.1 NAD(P)-binding protein [Gonapodya prolifera JEL478]